MKRKLVSIVSTVFLGALLAGCKSSQEQARTEPTDQSESSELTQEPMEQPPVAEAPMEQPTNDQLQQDVVTALEGAEGLDATQISVVVTGDGVIVLSGTVASEEEKRRAHEIAHTVAGVNNVYIGDLEVDTSRATK